jgi:long-chain acyl-CoA synthetase
LESIINTHYAVLTSTVIGVPHPYKGHVAKAFIVLKQGYKASKTIEKEIKELLSKNVAIYSLPAEYEFRDKLPQTLVGKVAFRELEKEEKERRKKQEKEKNNGKS